MKVLTLCGANIADFTIVLPSSKDSNPKPAEKTAADFIKRVILTACGVELPVSHQMTEHSIVIGSRETNPAIKWDGFRTATDDSHLYLHGNIPRGTLYAAYDFAEKYLGYRFFAEDCEVIPTDGEADIPSGLDIIDNPVFESRRHSWIGNLMNPEISAHNRVHDCVSDEAFGGGIPGMNYDCHTFARFCPPEQYFDEHPEYFSLSNGVRIPVGNAAYTEGQLCLTNPDVIRIVTENALKYLREHPETHVIDISQCDNRQYCECERCAAVDEEEGSHAGSMVRFINAIAEEVTKEFPNVYLRTFAYQYSRTPPKKTKAHPNVVIRYCTIDACFRHALNDMTCTENNGEYHFCDELTDWGKMADHLSIWNYSANYDSYITPFPNMATLRENVRLFAECGAIDIYEEDTSPVATPVNGAYGELKTYVLDKLLWDPYMSEETFRYHVNDFLKAYYGPGWLEIRKYIDLEHEATADIHIGCFAYCDMNYPLWFIPTEYLSSEIREHLKKNYDASPYQPALEDYPLLGLANRLDEAYALLQKAYDMAETDDHRKHIIRSRFSLDYLKLFCTPHIQSKMTKEEQTEYEEACKQFLEYKNKHNICYNLATGRYRKR